MTDFTKLYVTLILKDILKRIDSNNKKISALHKKNEENHLQDVGTSKYWKRQADLDFYIVDNELQKTRLVELNNQTDFMNNLHQDRFKFIEKYKKELVDIQQY